MGDSTEQTDAGDAASQTKPVPTTDLSGRQLGDFRLLRRLGHGAMADVYLAEQSNLRRRVAVKILRPELAEDRTYLKRFEIEAQAAASLVHANIVQIYEVGHVDRLHFIAQEYVQGQTLQEWISRCGPPDLPHALSIMRQVAAALGKAAERAVVHRDVKPDNIMITQSGEVKVADFGLARVVRDGEAVDLTQIGITLGTPLYMSPEQVEGKPLDHRSDLYSFGVTCYQMLSGSPPFRGETALAVAVQHLKKEPQPLEQARPDLPVELCRAVDKMLQKDPGQRYASATELLRDLRRIHLEHFENDWPEDLPGWENTGVELPADPRGMVTRELGSLMKTMAMRQPKRQRKLVWLGGVVAFLLLGGVVAWLLMREPYLLAEAEQAPPDVPHSTQDFSDQVNYAKKSRTVEAWQSVIDRFPNETTVVNRAHKELAEVYLRDGAYNSAWEKFTDFADDADDPARRAYGLAGQYRVETLRGEAGQLAAILGQLQPIRDELTGNNSSADARIDARMARLLAQAIRRTQSELDTATDDEWQTWCNDQLGPANEPRQANGPAPAGPAPAGPAPAGRGPTGSGMTN